ncbi:KDO2-lipid IV(A) lauroyltransferase [Daejeonella rubra]|uniref:KDO2-lipid IV(A) lauroyltransferase n=1 Tax=Daejeonella rubra TaxID=990371 RepID=A0A1G9W320_9SPHI|nr:lysophospholipid acyltransferase family protein [Daejeonella rubra]SDM78919.1 KDO2-lipid IV(A) lauroyltransferase [Daejeonella rubra]
MNLVFFKIISILLYLLSLLPFRILYLLSDILYLLLFYVFKYRRKVVERNLLNSFPEKTVEERFKIEKRFYKHLADLIFESIKTITISPETLRKRFVFSNLTELTNYFDAGKSVIAVSGHYGNWEWGPLAAAYELKQKVLVVYKPLSDKRFEQLINSMRSRFGAIMVPMKHTLRKIIEHKSQPHVLVLVGDQTPPREESHYFTRFLNQPTAIFLGVEKIAVRTNDPVIYFSINKIKRGYYECSIKHLVEVPNQTQEFEITNIHTRQLENIIRISPEYWLWSHKRWKFSPDNLKMQHD